MTFRTLLLAATTALATATISVSAQAQTEIVWGEGTPKGLDPHVVYDVPMQLYMLNAYDSLYRYIGNPPELSNWLAASHTVSEDGLTWEFTLKPGITFTDGTPMTSEDVVYSFQRLLEIGKGPSGAFKPVLKPENVSAVDELTTRFVLDKPYAPFLSTMPLVAILNKDVVQAHETDGDMGAAWLSTHQAGSGSYILDEDTYKPLENADFNRNVDHFYGWDDNASPVDVVHVPTFTETSTRVLALLRGDTDATDGYLPTDQVERIKAADGVRVQSDESMRIMLIRMNNQKPPFDNVNFRRCVSYAFNYDGFNEVVLGGLVKRNVGPLPSNLWGVDESVEGYSYDLDKAQEFCDLAREEGADIDRKIEIKILSGLDQTTQAAQVMQQGLDELGLNVEVVGDTWANLATSTGTVESTPDMWVHWVSTYFVDPENWIGQMYSSQFNGTWKASSWYVNPHVDDLLQQARDVTDQAEREVLYKEAYRTIVDEAADVWIYNTVALRGLSDRLDGFKFSPVGSGADFRWLSVKE
ncbi:ABC transporter substrate-binding protein [Pseudooceanicola sp. 502str34]